MSYPDMLVGVHIGEHGFDPDHLLEEIKERVIDPGYNFVTIRTRARKGEILPREIYTSLAKYLAKNKVYFIFLYTLDARSIRLKPSIENGVVEEMKSIAGEYFLGDMLGELGSNFGAKHAGYGSRAKVDPSVTRPYVSPRQDHRDMREAAEHFVQIANDYVQIDREIGMPHVALVEPTMLSKYLVMGGVDYPMVELMCSPPDMLVSYVRGVARAFGVPWGSYMAHEWYGGVRHTDPLKRKRLELGMKYAYLSGSSVMCIESGDEAITAYGDKHGPDSEICADYRRALSDINTLSRAETRHGSGPRVRVGFISGRYDAYPVWGGSSTWGQYEREEWGHGDAEHSWQLLREVGVKRQWWDIENFGREDLSAAPAYGMYDIVPIEADVDALSRYDYLIFLGWNTMTDEDMDKLAEYVSRGGRLLMSMAHLNYSAKRGGEFIAPPPEKLKKLFGIELTGISVRTNAGFKFSDSKSPELLYPRLPDDYSDPILTSGYAEYDFVKLCGAYPLAMLSDSFAATDGHLPLGVIENKIGDGFATLVCSKSYPGDPALTTVYRVLMRELLTASARTADVKVISSDRLRYSVYEDGRIYLLNTDYDLPITVMIERGGERAEYTLAPLELKIVGKI